MYFYFNPVFNNYQVFLEASAAISLSFLLFFQVLPGTSTQLSEPLDTMLFLNTRTKLRTSLCVCVPLYVSYLGDILSKRFRNLLETTRNLQGTSSPLSRNGHSKWGSLGLLYEELLCCFARRLSESMRILWFAWKPAEGSGW